MTPVTSYSLILIFLALHPSFSFRCNSRIWRPKSSLWAVTDTDTTFSTIEDLLEDVDEGLKETTIAIFRSCKEIAYKIRTCTCEEKECTTVEDGSEEQITIATIAKRSMYQNLKLSNRVAIASSAEERYEEMLGGEGYAIAFTSLDGAAANDNVESNLAVGATWGIWPGNKLTSISGRDLASAGLAVFGPVTTLTVAFDGINSAHEFVLIDDFSANHGQWKRRTEYTKWAEGRLVIPGELGAMKDNAGYRDLFNFWMMHSYQLRSTGGLAPNINTLLVEGKGVLVDVPSADADSPILKALHEVAPIAFIVEKAGGASSDGECSLLDLEILSIDQVSQAAFGSHGEVARFEQLVGPLVR